MNINLPHTSPSYHRPTWRYLQGYLQQTETKDRKKGTTVREVVWPNLDSSCLIWLLFLTGKTDGWNKDDLLMCPKSQQRLLSGFSLISAYASAAIVITVLQFDALFVPLSIQSRSIMGLITVSWWLNQGSAACVVCCSYFAWEPSGVWVRSLNPPEESIEPIPSSRECTESKPSWKRE